MFDSNNGVGGVALMKACNRKVKLTQSFAHGLFMTPPHRRSLGGVSFHNFGLKTLMIDLHGVEGCLRLLKDEHEALRAALAQIGLSVHEIIPDQRLPDDTFVCDSTSNAVKLLEDGLEILVISTRMGEPSRRDETTGVIAKLLEVNPEHEVKHLKAPAKFETGDLHPMFFGDFCLLAMGKRNRVSSPNGLGVRTNSEGRRQIAGLYREFYGDNFLGGVSIPHTKLHSGTAFEVMQVGEGEDIVLLHNEGLTYPKKTCEALRNMTKKACPKIKFRSIKVPQKESWGAPVLTHNGFAICDERFEKIIKILESLGFNVLTVPAVMHQALDGNFRCKIQPYACKSTALAG